MRSCEIASLRAQDPLKPVKERRVEEAIFCFCLRRRGHVTHIRIALHYRTYVTSFFSVAVKLLLSAILLLTLQSRTPVFGQDVQSDKLPVRTDTLTVVGAGPFLIRPFMVPGSEIILLDGDPLNDRVYSINYRPGFLELRGRDPTQVGQLVITYSYIPISVADSVRKWAVRYPDMEAPVGQVRRSLTGSTGQPSSYTGSRLRRSGSITRGITTGTSRDVAIESGLRLQVDGQIVEGLELRAVLTDESTPILPEGSTQRLNEFDRVFIELKSSVGAVQLGDFDGRIDGGEFAQLTRKLQGATVFGRVGARSGSFFQGGSIAALGATSRGIFRVQEIQPIDGVQGPYRLEDKGGGRFIILLPGSEVVYVDGQRKQRGESNDYVVDYTTGEITFMPGLWSNFSATGGITPG